MKTYLMLFDEDNCPDAVVATLPFLAEVRREDGEWLVRVLPGDEHAHRYRAVYVCADEAAAFYALQWIERYGETPAEPPGFDWARQCWVDSAGNMTRPNAEQAAYRRAMDTQHKGYCLFRNGAPRGPKGGAK